MCPLCCLLLSLPQIRKACAEQVYLVLLQNGDLVPEDKLEKALEIISETSWEGDIEEAKRRRLELCHTANLENVVQLIMSKSGTLNSGQRKAASDENATYSSLVGSAGF